jgi:hypothetical protein
MLLFIGCGRTPPWESIVVETDATEDTAVDDAFDSFDAFDAPRVDVEEVRVDTAVPCPTSDLYVEMIGGPVTRVFRLGCSGDPVPSWVGVPCCGEDAPPQPTARACDAEGMIGVIHFPSTPPAVGYLISPLGTGGTTELAITRDDRIIGGVVEGRYVARVKSSGDAAPPLEIHGAFRVCRAITWDL